MKRRTRTNYKSKSTSGAIIIIIIIVVLLMSCGGGKKSKGTASDESKVESKEAITVDAPELFRADGLNDLQSLFLQIDDSYTKEQIEAIAEKNGFVVEENNSFGEYIYLSETEAVDHTFGEIHRPLFATDCIEVYLTQKEGENDGNYYVFSKGYHMPGDLEERDDVEIMEYTFYDDSLDYYAGEEDNHTTLSDSKWDTLEDSLRELLKAQK